MFFLRYFFLILVLISFFSPEPSYAETQDAFIAPLCNVVDKIQGPWGKGLLVVGAIFVGVNVFIGKFSFPMLIGFIAAGALILSPQMIINVLSGANGGTAFDCAIYKTAM